MKTDRLYYEDAYLHSFSARVTSIRPGWVELDRTAFYPEGGGQPADHGWLNDAAVIDTQIDECGVVWHQVATDLPVGAMVQGRVDWQRRFDHMQQHSGQHVLSQAFWQLYRTATVGFHLGEQVVTIDVDRSDLSEQELQQAEELANAVIRSKRVVLTKFVAEDALPLEELRKLPQMKEDIRLVAIDGFDICPCGGTHVLDLGDVGLLKLLSWEKRRGNLRVSFAAGRRAYADYHEKHRLLQQLSGMLSQPVAEVAQGVARQTERIGELEKQVKALQSTLLEQEALRLLAATADNVGRTLIVCQQLDPHWSPEQIKELANILVDHGGVAAVLGLPGDSGFRLVLAFSSELQLHAGNLLKQIVKLHAGKGGGSAQTAQGMVPVVAGEQALLDLKRLLLEQI